MSSIISVTPAPVGYPLNCQSSSTPKKILFDFINGNTTLTHTQLIDTLKKMQPDIERQYMLPAGVTEGYTIEQHTLRVLQTFEEFDNINPIKNFLHEMGLSKEQFIFFLALHDIGKGKAVEEIKILSPERKEKELQYCREIIRKIATDIGLDEKIILIYEALLADDNIGGLLKSDYITKGFALKTAEELKVAADSCKLSLAQFTHLKILFHKVDAGSYPTLAHLFKPGENNNLVYQDTLQNKINILAKIVQNFPQPCEETSTALKTITTISLPEELGHLTLGQFLKKDPNTFTIDEVVLLDAVRKSLKESHSKYYNVFSSRVTWIKECKLPFRLIAALKYGPHYWSCSNTTIYNLCGIRTFWTDKCDPTQKGDDKDTLEKIKKLIMQNGKSIESKLKALEKLTFLHGTNSATLAMMHISTEWALKSTGNILATKKAPMCGEIAGGGYGINGVNIHHLSAETIRNIDTALSYSQRNNNILNIDGIVKTLQYPNDDQVYDQLYDSCFPPYELTLKFTYKDLLDWRKNDETSFWEMFGPKRENLKNKLHEQCDKIREKINNTPKGENCDEQYQILSLYMNIILLLWPTRDINELNKEHYDHSLHSSWKEEKERWEHPLDTQLNIRNLGVTGIRLLQLRQWDNDLYQKEINTKYLRARAQAMEHKSLLEAAFPTYCNESAERISNRQEKIKQWYKKFYDILDLTNTPITIPKDPEMRELFTKPFPVIFASSTYRPTPRALQDDEFIIFESVALGSNGVDVIITDTDNNREKIKKMLPENLKSEIHIYLLDEIIPKDFPLIHARHQIRI